MTPGEQKVWEQVSRRRQTCIEFLQELVRASEGGLRRTGCPRSLKEAVQECVADKYGALGCDIDIIRYDPASLPVKHEFASQRLIDASERMAVVGTLKGAGDGRSILF